MGDRRKLEIRAIVASFRSAERKSDHGMAREARQRARQMLEHVAIRIDPERDEELATLLREARRAVAEPPA